jgi:hypothetical protein
MWKDIVLKNHNRELKKELNRMLQLYFHLSLNKRIKELDRWIKLPLRKSLKIISITNKSS